MKINKKKILKFKTCCVFDLINLSTLITVYKLEDVNSPEECKLYLVPYSVT